MERQKFEESFRKSFGNAEVPPSEKVWMNIELDLERLERGHMKKRITFFKLLAAASVVFGLGLAGTGVYLFTTNRSASDLTAQHNDSKSIPYDSESVRESVEVPEHPQPERSAAVADNSAPSSSTPAPSSSTPAPSAGEPSAPSLSDQSATADVKPAIESSHTPSDAVAAFGQHEVSDQVAQTTPRTGHVIAPDEQNERQFSITTLSNRPLPALVKQRKVVPQFPKTEPDQIDLLLASIEMEERAAAERKKYDGERIWTSVGFSAGTFSNYGAGTSQSPSLMASTSNLTSVSNTLTSESKASGVAYSVGVNVGGRIAPRWVLQGGINYITQNASFTSDAVVTEDYRNFTAAYSAEITKLADASARVVPTAPYSVSNNMEFLSIPIQAGYLLVNRAFGVQLTGGVATDLFIQNTLQPQSGNLDKVTNGNGSDSPYRTVNFSGLVGTEFSYRFSEKYRISLNPGLRYPFNSIYKSDVGLSATPITFDVGLRFRYIFD